MSRLVSRLTYVGAVLLICGYGLFALRGPGGIPGLLEKQRQIRELEKSNAALARQIEQKRAHISRLQDDQGEWDKTIRDWLKLVKPGEKVFVLQDKEKK